MSPRVRAHKAPFPYFGGKATVADEVWARLGDVSRYVEPFAGSLAVLLARPEPYTGREIVNDLDGLLVNAWRAMTHDPDGVAKWADWPATENDLHARHSWLVELVVDHAISVDDGGATDVENLVAACVDCNSGKGNRSVLPVVIDAGSSS